MPGRVEWEKPVYRPIFVVGSGRSGTTLLYRLICGHRDLAWVSGLTDRYPQWPQLSVLTRLPHSEWKQASGLRRVSKLLKPSGVYEYCQIASLLQQKRTSLTEADVSDLSRRQLRKIVRAHLKWMGRPRFINKNTANTMRVRYLREIFPDALFVHIIRNGYAVANSLNSVAWWPDLELWWLGKTPKQWVKESGRHPLELCAMHWKRQVQEILTHKNHLPPEQYLECRYEDLVTNPKGLLQNILRSCRLEWNAKFEEHVNSMAIENRNYKWRDSLDAASKGAIYRAAGDLLEELGYERPETDNLDH